MTPTGVPAPHQRSRQQIRTTRHTELPDLRASADIAEESPAARNGGSMRPGADWALRSLNARVFWVRLITVGVPAWPVVLPGLGRCHEVEGAWSVMKNGLGNLAAGTTDQLAAAILHQLDRIQRPPALITGFLSQTGLSLEPEPP